MINYHIKPGGTLNTRLSVPGDKSISHRSVLLGSLAHGKTRVIGLLRSDDVLALVNAMRKCGVEISDDSDVVTIEGNGLYSLVSPNDDIDCGNSGTAMRLLAGVFAGQHFAVKLFGDESLSKRPMKRVADPLGDMGSMIMMGNGAKPPLSIEPVDKLKPISWEMRVASAQVKSAILLAGLYVDGETRVFESTVTRNHTENLLELFGCPIKFQDGWISMQGGDNLKARDLAVPGDISSAAFLIAAALLDEESELVIESVGINPTRTGLLEAFRRMGGNIEVINGRMIGKEPVADLRITGAGGLIGAEIGGKIVPSMIDEMPILAVTAAFAKGITRISDCEELRYKESDRIRTVVRGLKSLGVKVEEKQDGMVIEGGFVGGGTVNSFGDHRIAMAFAIAGLRSSSDVHIQDCACVSTSFPNFVELAQETGIDINQKTV